MIYAIIFSCFIWAIGGFGMGVLFERKKWNGLIEDGILPKPTKSVGQGIYEFVKHQQQVNRLDKIELDREGIMANKIAGWVFRNKLQYLKTDTGYKIHDLEIILK